MKGLGAKLSRFTFQPAADATSLLHSVTLAPSSTSITVTLQVPTTFEPQPNHSARSIQSLLDEIENCLSSSVAPFAISRDDSRDLKRSGWASVSIPRGEKCTSYGNVAVARLLEKVLSFEGEGGAEAATRVRTRVRDELSKRAATDSTSFLSLDSSYSLGPISEGCPAIDSSNSLPFTTIGTRRPLVSQTVRLPGLSPLAPTSRIPPGVQKIALRIDAIYAQELASLKTQQG